jgi:hypothetical protein
MAKEEERGEWWGFALEQHIRPQSCALDTDAGKQLS